MARRPSSYLRPLSVSFGSLTLLCLVVERDDDEVALKEKAQTLAEMAGVSSDSHRLGLLLMSWGFPTYRFRQVLMEAAQRGVRWVALAKAHTEELEEGVNQRVVSGIVTQLMPSAIDEDEPANSGSVDEETTEPRPPRNPHIDTYFANVPLDSTNDKGF